MADYLCSIFSGLAVDYYGPELGALVSSVFVLLGSLTAAIGASRASFDTIVAGEIILGLGSSKLPTLESTSLAHMLGRSNH